MSAWFFIVVKLSLFSLILQVLAFFFRRNQRSTIKYFCLSVNLLRTGEIPVFCDSIDNATFIHYHAAGIRWHSSASLVIHGHPYLFA
ncbi:MAG: hypothetical protein L3J84_01900 [Gammaproteobacteria bacterium]|nr:hypothetical protein [Gammaproteobacteria bacterium]